MSQAIDPHQIRPPRAWYGVAVVVAVMGIVAGVGAFAAGIVTVSRALPDLQTTSKSGVAVQIQLSAARQYAFYLPASSTASCYLTPTQGVHREPPGYTLTFTSGGRQWQLADEFSVATSGNYTAACAGTTFAVGSRPQTTRFIGGIGLGIAALLGLPCMSLVLGTLIGVVVAIRRRRHRTRLLASGGYFR